MARAAARAGPVIVTQDERPSLGLLHFENDERLIAASALVHDMAIIIRNGRDCAGTGIGVVDPWQP